MTEEVVSGWERGGDRASPRTILCDQIRHTPMPGREGSALEPGLVNLKPDVAVGREAAAGAGAFGHPDGYGAAERLFS